MTPCTALKNISISLLNFTRYEVVRLSWHSHRIVHLKENIKFIPSTETPSLSFPLSFLNSKRNRTFNLKYLFTICCFLICPTIFDLIPS